MPKFSKKSEEKLLQCHMDLQLIFNHIIKIYDISIICGHRNKEEQEKAYKNRRSKLSFPKSKHNSIPSIAIDVVPYPLNWEDYKSFYYLGGLVKATYIDLLHNGYIDHQIRWGGDWNNSQKFDDQKFNDLAHFELKE